MNGHRLLKTVGTVLYVMLAIAGGIALVRGAGDFDLGLTVIVGTCVGIVLAAFAAWLTWIIWMVFEAWMDWVTDR